MAQGGLSQSLPYAASKIENSFTTELLTTETSFVCVKNIVRVIQFRSLKHFLSSILSSGQTIESAWMHWPDPDLRILNTETAGGSFSAAVKIWWLRLPKWEVHLLSALKPDHTHAPHGEFLDIKPWPKFSKRFSCLQTNQKNALTARICKEGLKEVDPREVYGGGGGGGGTFVFKVRTPIRSTRVTKTFLSGVENSL